MKTQTVLFSKICLLVFLFLAAINLKAEIRGDTLSPPALSFLQAPPDASIKPLPNHTPALAISLEGYGHNVQGGEFYSIDPQLPGSQFAMYPFATLTASGDFAPGDPGTMYTLSLGDNTLLAVDINDGTILNTVSLTMPLEGGLWTVLAINKVSGIFYAVVTTTTESMLYSIDPISGIESLIMDLGIPAVISGSFDGGDNLYLFDIAQDNIWVVNVGAPVSRNEATLLGPAGFDGNYAQGMGYCPWMDEIFLAAFTTTQDPQLRQLDRTTGLTTFIAELPGETTAFGFPSEASGEDDFLMAGQDLYTIPAASLIMGEDLPPIPQGFFDPGSEPFIGNISLTGQNSNGGQLPNEDLVISRMGDIPIPAPLPSGGEVQIEIIQLNLRSTQPIIVQTGTGESLWDVEVHLVPSMPQQGFLSATKQDLNGGDFFMQLVLMPELVFTEVDNPDNVRFFNPSEFGTTGLQLFSGDALPWMAPPIAYEMDPFWDVEYSIQTPAGSEIVLIPLLKRQDYAFLSMDQEGQPESWEGTGINNSEWYYYPFTDWWNVWFYDHPLAVDRRKFVGGVFTVMPRDPSQPSYVEVILGWSTPEWPTWNGFPEQASPPLPDMLESPEMEQMMIERTESMYTYEGTITEEVTVDIPADLINTTTGLFNYNPEWIFIDVRGYNFMIYNELDHICFKPWPTCEVICPEDMEVCATDEPFTLSGASPAGGTYSGSGVDAVGTFNPGQANWGENIITYTYVCPDGTVVTCTFIIYVIPPPEMVCPPNLELCYSDNVVSIPDGIPGGGTFTGPGMVGGNSFSTIQAGVGTHTITYSVTEPCPGSCTFTITVHPNPEVECPDDFEMCANDAPIDLMTLVSPQGGTFTGGQMFDPGTSVGGPWQIKYTYTDPDTGCEGSCVFYITVHPTPEVDCPDDFNMCEDDAPIDMMTLVSPQGGSFGGGQMYDPSTAPLGVPIQIKYTYTDANGCTASCVFYITVWPNPDVECPEDMEMCIDDSPVGLSASPAGGTFSGPGIGGNSFNPANAGVGTHTIEYCYTDPQTGCEACCEFKITVHPTPEVDCPDDFNMCEDDAPIDMMTLVSPQGGSFGGGQMYDPSTAPLGVPIQIKYTYTDDNGCTASCVFYITVWPNPDVECPEDMEMCIDDSPVALSASPAGGTFSGPGIGGNSFNPANAGVGTHTIEYCYTDPQTGCEACCEFKITVHPLPDVECPDDIEKCIDDPAFALTGATPAGGIYSGQGVAGGSFNPATAGAGVKTITYTYTDPQTGCSNSCTFKITVHPLPNVTCPANIVKCIDDPAFVLGGATPAGGTYSNFWGTPFVNFNPAAWGIGVHTIYYDYTDPNTGCSNWCSFTVTVHPLPVVTCPANIVKCIDDPAFALGGAAPAGGTYSDFWGTPFVNFNPAAWGVGVHTIYYDYTDPNTNCSNWCSFTVTVHPLPVVTCPANIVKCIDDPAFALGGAAPAGGTYSDAFGIPVANFNPAAWGVGVHTIYYDYTDPNTGCSNWCSFTVTVHPLPVVTCPANIVKCIDDPAFALGGAAPAGGTYSDAFGIPVANFNPAAWGVGAHTIFYDYTDPNTNCSNWCSFTITVIDPNVNCPQDTAVCENDSAFILSGATPAGGVYSGIGVSLVGGNYEFDPSVWGPGTVTIQYVYTVPGTNCSDTCYFDIIIHENPVVDCPPNDTICESDPDFALGGGVPAGGVYKLNGNPVNIFKPSWGPGTYPITYTYTNAVGCADSCTFSIVVRPDPVAVCPANMIVNLTDPAFALAGGAPAGGVYTDAAGNAIAVFNPAAAGLGVHTITYTYTDEYGCSDSCTFTITVIDQGDSLDFGDAPDGIAGFNFRTVLATDGARHIINSTIFLGDKIDGEGDGQPTLGADGDDLNLTDDEDGVFLPAKVYPGATTTVGVKASIDGFLDVWMDFNLNGNWTDAGEHIFVSQAVSAGMNALSFTVPTRAAYGMSYMRFRFRDNPAPISHFGLVQNGEVEDYFLLIDEEEQPQDLDFGDAPDSIPGFDYHTRLLNNGARHVIDPDVFLGNLIDAEVDGQPTINALGDDNTNLDDEDGVRIRRFMAAGAMAKISVKASIDGYLNAWVDYNQDGDWSDAGEQIFTDQPLAAGWNTLSFLVPASAKKGSTYARFRFNTSGGLSFEGLADDGEVEDYRLAILPEDWAYDITDLSHIIVIPEELNQVMFAGAPFTLESGDIIGSFYGIRAGERCGGAVVKDRTGILTLMAFGNDPLTGEKDGFDEGEDFNFRVYRPSTGEEFEVEATFDPTMPNSDGKFHNNGLSAFTALNLSGLSQILAIPEGWSGISTWLEPLDTDVENMFSPVEDGLVILYNEDGMYWPGENTNTLGQWNSHKGYVVKMANDAMLSVEGEELMDVSVNLAVGWNTVPVLSTEPFNIEMLFSTLPGFVAAKDVAGMGVYLPGYGINTIGNMIPGGAYYAYTTQAGTVSFISIEVKSTTEYLIPYEPVSPWNEISYTPESHIVVFNAPDAPFMVGDIVGGFTSDGYTAGVAEVRTDKAFALTLNGNDVFTNQKTGFDDGELLTYKVHRPSTGENFVLEVVYNPDMTMGSFTTNGISEITHVKASALGVDDLSASQISIYPNPSSGMFNITGVGGLAEIEVCNAYGKLMLRQTLDLSEGIDLSSYPNGVYLLKIVTDKGAESMHKLIVH